MDSELTIFTPTHVAETSFDEITACVEAFHKKAKGFEKYKHLIVCDSDPAKGELVDKYIDFLRELETKHTQISVIHRKNSGLRKNYLYAVEHITSPYMMFLEHDWELTTDIDLDLLVRLFREYPQVNYLRFNHLNNNDMSGYDNYHEDCPEIPLVPLLKVDAWHNVVHMIRREHFKNSWAPLIDTWSIEACLTQKYQQQVAALGFTEAHKRWGTYIYGKTDSSPVVYKGIGICF